ncbi:MAG: ComF family protein [Sarcina sp.]
MICTIETDSGVICANCYNKKGEIKNEYKFNGITIYSSRYYSSEFRKLLYEYKVKRNFEVGEYFIELLNRKIIAQNLKFDFITFIPSNNATNKKRGFDNGKYLADGIGKYFDIRVLNILKKRELVKEQKYLNANEREKNMLDAFSISKLKFDIDGKTILIVDDIVTTGATLKICGEMIVEKYNVNIIYLTVLKSSI